VGFFQHKDQTATVLIKQRFIVLIGDYREAGRLNLKRDMPPESSRNKPSDPRGLLSGGKSATRIKKRNNPLEQKDLCNRFYANGKIKKGCQE